MVWYGSGALVVGNCMLLTLVSLIGWLLQFVVSSIWPLTVNSEASLAPTAYARPAPSESCNEQPVAPDGMLSKRKTDLMV